MRLFPHVSLMSLVYYFLMTFENAESRSLKLTQIKCIPLNESTVIFKTCELKAINRERTELSMYAKLLQIPITNAKMSLLIRKRINNYKRSIYEYRLDLCAFFRNKRRNPVADLFYNFFGLNTHSNLNHTCPYNHDFCLDHYPISNKYDIALPLPVGPYDIHLFFETDGAKWAEVSGLLEVFVRK